MAVLDELTADVEANSDVVASVEALVAGFAERLAAAIAAGADPAVLQALHDELTANTARLAAAVVAGTPAAPTPAPPVVEPVV
jgi:ABC-type glycerol-3-phosphate transport system substrate-binding protein